MENKIRWLLFLGVLPFALACGQTPSTREDIQRAVKSGDRQAIQKIRDADKQDAIRKLMESGQNDRMKNWHKKSTVKPMQAFP